jgi:hypothetical protein
MMQSWFAPVIMLVFWGLLRAGMYSRGWFYFSGLSLQGICGLRTFISTVFQRLATLKHVTFMVNAKSGTIERMARRRSYLTKEWIKVVIVLTFHLFLSVLIPISMVLFGSTFNSRQMAIHAVAMNVPIEIISGLFNFQIHYNINKKRKPRKPSTEVHGIQAGIHTIRRTSPKRGNNIKISPCAVSPKSISLPDSGNIMEQLQCYVRTFTYHSES